MSDSQEIRWSTVAIPVADSDYFKFWVARGVEERANRGLLARCDLATGDATSTSSNVDGPSGPPETVGG